MAVTPISDTRLKQQRGSCWTTTCSIRIPPRATRASESVSGTMTRVSKRPCSLSVTQVEEDRSQSLISRQAVRLRGTFSRTATASGITSVMNSTRCWVPVKSELPRSMSRTGQTSQPGLPVTTSLKSTLNPSTRFASVRLVEVVPTRTSTTSLSAATVRPRQVTMSEWRRAQRSQRSTSTSATRSRMVTTIRSQ